MSYCNIYVKDDAGKPRKGIKISGTYGMISYSNNFYTDSNGYCRLEWNSSNPCIEMNVDGKNHKGKWENGGTYTFIVNWTLL